MCVTRIHKGEEKIVCCFGAFLCGLAECLLWFFLCFVVSLSFEHSHELCDSFLCCFKIISSFHGNYGIWLSKFQSNFQALLLETVTNNKFVNLKETSLPSCTAVKICMVHLWEWHYLSKGWGEKPWAFHFSPTDNEPGPSQGLGLWGGVFSLSSVQFLWDLGRHCFCLLFL